MAVRTTLVRPEPDTGMVDREKLVQAIMDGEATMWLAGGVLSIVPQRAPTGVPGEMVTVAVMIEWKDRTDARPQPETPTPVVPAAAPAGVEPAQEEELPLDDARVPVAVGAEEEPEPEEDDSAIPEALR